MNHKGFSIVETAVVLAIISVLMLALSNIFINFVTKSVDIQKRSMENVLQTSISHYIMNPKNCSQELSNYYLPKRASNDPLSIPSSYCESSPANECNLSLSNYKGYGDDAISPGGSHTGLQRGSIISEADLRINTFKMVRKPPGNPLQKIIINDQKKEMHLIRIFLGFTKIKENKALKARHFDVVVTVDETSKKIEYCGEGNFCYVMGGTWDMDSSRCVPSRQCYVRGSYITFTSSHSQLTKARVSPNPVTGEARCPKGSTSTKIGEFLTSYNVRVSKKSNPLVTDTYTSYMCLQCN